MWLLCLLFLRVNSHVIEAPHNFTSPCIDKNHLFLAPGVLSAGGANRACISRFYPEGPARMVVTLLADNGESTTAARDLPPGDGGCLDLPVPLRPNTKADLVVNMRYLEVGCSWERRMSVRIASGRVVGLHTERARYRPGDLVRARAVILKPDLTPAHNNIDEIWLEGPQGPWEGTRAAQWSGLRTRLGLAQIQHQLDDHAPPGKWTFRAKLSDGSQGSTTFWVGNYEVPPFQLTVRHAPRVLKTSERLVWTVCVRYPWTEAVEGMLVIRLRGAGGDGSGGVRTAVRLRAPRACHRHAAAAWRVGLGGQHPPDVVIADFSFQEEGTRVWQNTTVVSQVVDSPVTLEFLTKHRAVLSPSLPYKMKVKATRWDDKPAVGELIRVCQRAERPVCVTAKTDSRGVARALFAAEPSTNAIYIFEASLHNVTATLQLAVRTAASRAALGPLRADAYATRTLVPLYLNLRGLSSPITVHFVVITRGGIIYRWGATTQCPVAASTTQIKPALRNSTCNANLEKLLPTFDSSLNNLDVDPNQLDVNASDSLLDRHLLRVMLPIRVTHQMCPDSHLLAYFYHNGELVSASKHFEMDECFGNKVEASWTSRQSAPGTTATLRLSTPGPALCALTALDTASTWVEPPPSVKDVLLQALRRLIDGHRNLTEYDAAGDCFLTSDSPELPSSGIDLTRAWLAAAGVRMLGEETRTHHCDGPAPALLQDQEDHPPRSDFSEAWLWRLVPVGLNGSATTSARSPDSITRYEAGAVCLARSGIAMSSPAVLQVFREFFIHADGPRNLRRGDAAIIKYRLFNYLYEPLSVQIQVLTDPHLSGGSRVESACVAARGSVARRIEIQALVPGTARLSIRAHAVNDNTCGNTNKSNVSDEVIIEIEVEPEGVPLQEYKSIMLCAKGSSEPAQSNVSWTWSAVQAVADTEEVSVWAATNAIAPLLADADALVLLPRGCGEQNMARMATNLLAFSALDPQSPAAAVAKEHVARGFTRQLQYVHPGGGFSAFGSSDSSPSTWLTAFCLRYMRRAHQVISPGLPYPPAIERAERWLLSQQMENGCFRNEGQVFHAELRGGLNEESEIANVALTAYVITSLVESSLNLPFKVIQNSLSCLRAIPPTKSKTHTGVYAHSLLAYAFMRLRGYEDELRKTNEAYLWDREVASGLKDEEELRELMVLLKLAKRNREYVYWESGSLSTSIEATGYGALALANCPLSLRASCAADARAATRWLAAHRSPTGGFLSTQDTLVAMEALTAWSLLDQPIPSNLTVKITSGAKTASINLVPESMIPDVVHLSGSNQLSISVKGSGCALVQATRSYRSVNAQESTGRALRAQVSVRTDGAFDCANNDTACFCAAVVETCVVWSGSFPEMALLEVTLPGGFGADAALLYSQLQRQDTLLRRIELSPNGGRATLYLGGRGADSSGAEHRCFALHAVGPRARTAPAHVKLLDYYRPTVKDVQVYTIPEDCPARISHDTNTFLHKDNLFNKAKSLETGEIIISHEFSFEDIPEGTPLEDPIFENLTEKKDIINIERRKKDDDKDKHVTKIPNAMNILNEGTSQTFSNGGISRSEAKIKNQIENISYNENNSIDNQTVTDNKNMYRAKENEIFDETIMERNEKIKLPANTSNDNTPTDGAENDIKVDNPNLSSFHVIDSEKDLEFPTGIEGPVPSVVLPPDDFTFTPVRLEPSRSTREMDARGGNFRRRADIIQG
ncbi:murinoglobulin-2-like [Battus philenor]|uniref:murinoglobulin-2-like n=1 Tax=Battus philenor TaxID=42288 RepID=UPI0035D01894